MNLQLLPLAPRTQEFVPEGLREIRVFLIGMGIALIFLGMAAIGSSFVATLATATTIGFLLLLGAIFQIVTALWGRGWPGFALHLLAGVLYLIAGVFVIENPFEAAVSLTFLIAVVLLVGGVFRMVLSLLERFRGWGWVFLNGVVSAALGVGIGRQWPLSGLWVIGLFVGIELLFSGLSWTMLGLMLCAGSKTEISM
ncbi:MAG: HdeD family acid-resistance protein [Gemmataceae bacterium]